MILFLIFTFYVSGLIAEDTPPKPAIDITQKPMMCEYRKVFNNSCVPEVGVECFPCECEIILYQDFCINNKSVITVDKEDLKKVASLRPTIVILVRETAYTEWVTIVEPENAKKDVEVLCKFAKEYNIIGFKVVDLSPRTCFAAYNDTFVANLPNYLKSLKCWDGFIVGVNLYPEPPVLKNPCITDFCSMNPLVDFYELDLYQVNSCEPDLYNGRLPIEAQEHCADYQLGLDEIMGYLEQTPIDLSKLYLTIEMTPVDKAASTYFECYDQVCSTTDYETWCIQNTQDFFNKGAYAKKKCAGINAKYVQLDDSQNTCGCGPFIGFQNVVSGYKGGSTYPCPKFDVQEDPGN